MAQPRLTTYANLVKMRLTSRELVLEFSAHFPEEPSDQAAAETEVRIVLPSTALEGIVKLLTDASAEREKQVKAAKTAKAEKPS